MKRIGFLGIVVRADKKISIEIQRILNEHSNIIIGRMGVPDKENQLSAICLISEGKVEEISALSGKLGKLNNVDVKSTLLSADIIIAD